MVTDKENDDVAEMEEKGRVEEVEEDAHFFTPVGRSKPKWGKTSSEQFWKEMYSPTSLWEERKALASLVKKDEKVRFFRRMSFGDKEEAETRPSKRKALSSPQLHDSVQYEERMMELEGELVGMQVSLTELSV
ncbi:hypothetical protein WA026_000001, partial [Henosepilachna vigintioctopunctata]